MVDRPRLRKKNERGYGTLTTDQLNSRSRLTNGATFLPDVDGRSSWARRYRDILHAHIADLGGRDMLTEGQLALVRSIALMQCEAEFQTMRVALLREEDTAPGLAQMDHFRAQAESQRRLIETLGLHAGRKARDVTPRGDQTEHVIDGLVNGRYAGVGR